MKTFEEFLKEKKRKSAHIADVMFQNKEGEHSVILLKDLGEWALKEVDIIRPVKDLNWELVNLRPHPKLLLEIAIACLGKAEVETRLRREGR